MNWFLYKLRDADADTQAAAKLLLTFALITTLTSSGFFPVYYYLGRVRVAAFTGAVVPLIFSTALILRWTGSLTFSSHYYLASAWLFVTGAITLLGGISSPGTPAYFVLVMGATFMLGRRAGVVWTIICVFTLIGVELVRYQWAWSIPLPATELSVLGASTYATILILICVFSLKYEEVKNTVLNELRGVNRRTVDMIAKLERASDRLVHSSEHLLGTEQDKSQGLVGMMMQSARAGRHTIEDARESISGMIEQYRHISERVRDLYRHTQTIIELVSTIDRISARLDLMALNIGIEATRSGTNGKQFTVIARDMRNLAERVLNETQRIKSSLQSVNTQAQWVLQSSTIGQDLTEEGIVQMNAMVNTFDALYALIEKAESTTEKVTADTLVQIDAVRRLVTVAETDTISKQ